MKVGQSPTDPCHRWALEICRLKTTGGNMNKAIRGCRQAATLGLVALLAGCGGGGGGSTPTPTCTANCVSGQVTDSAGGGVSGVYVTATNPATNQVCFTSPTGSNGGYTVSTSACGSGAVVLTAPVGGGTVVNSWAPGQSTTGVNLNPGTTSSVAAYAGTWSANYVSSLSSGGDSGSCSVVVNAAGVIDAAQNSNNCTSKLSGTFTLTGALNAQGYFAGTATTGAAYSGQFVVLSKSASGIWQNSGTNDQGTWTATLH